MRPRDLRCPPARRLAVTYRLSRKRLLQQLIMSLTPSDQSPDADAASAQAAGSAAGAGAGVSEAESAAELRAIVRRFNDWVAAEIPDSKIHAMAVPGMRLGAVAVADIAAEEVRTRAGRPRAHCASG